MEAKPLLQKIEADAREAAAQVLAAARDKARALVEASDAGIEELNLRTSQRIERDSQDMRTRMQRMDELEGRKALLSDKRDVMDETFREALRMLTSMDANAARAFFEQRLLATAQGDEQVKPGTQGGGVDQAMLDQVNRQLQAQGKPGQLTLSEERVPGVGFALARGGIEVVCTFERLVHDARMGLETEVAGILFP